MLNELLFFKFQALGSDYLVLDPTVASFEMTPTARPGPLRPAPWHRLPWVLLGPLPVPEDPQAFGLRIFNPDGSEAEKSGDGLRMFARYLLEAGHAKNTGCRIHTAGGAAEVRFLAQDGSLVQVDMGRPSFRAGHPLHGHCLPSRGPGDPGPFSGAIAIPAVSMGNPHCVLFPGQVPQTMPVGSALRSKSTRSSRSG